MRFRLLAANFFLWPISGAQAEVQKLAEAGWWAVHGGIRDDGAFTCALVTATPDGRGGQFIIEHLHGTNSLFIRMLKPSWTMPRGKSFIVTIQFGFLPPKNVEMLGSGTELRAELPWSQASEFMRQFQGSGRIDVTFNGGTESPWSLATGGEGIVEPYFVKCLNMTVQRPASPPTQP